MEISYLVIIIHMIFTVISLCQFAYHKKAGQTARTYYLCIEKSGRTNVGEFFEGAKEKSDQQGA
jgi:hypothetical protein